MDEPRWSNIAALRERYDVGASNAAAGPIEAFFEVSARCNLRCQMCAINHDSRYRRTSGRPPFLEPDVFDRLRPIFPTLVRCYLFGLGEPTMNPHLVDYARELSDAGVGVWFNTNATLIDERKAEELALAGVEAITVSIDGATAATYERIRRGASFDRVMRGLRALSSARRKYGRPMVDLSFVAMAGNIAELPDLVELCAEVGATGIHVEPLYYQNQNELMEHYERENLGVVGASDLGTILTQAQNRSKVLGVVLKSRFLAASGPADYVERAKTMVQDWRCSEPWSSIWVTTAGEIRTCCLNDTTFGVLLEEPFEHIWNGANFGAFREAHATSAPPASCMNCRRNGRVRQSPFFTAVRPVTYEPRIRREEMVEAPDRAMIDTPIANGLVTDPIVISGIVGPGETDRLTLLIDDEPMGAIGDSISLQDGSFVLTGDVPYLSEGAHVVSFRDGKGTRWGHRQFFLWRPECDSLRVVDEVALRIPLHRRIRRPRFTIDRTPWERFSWRIHETDGRFVGIARLDVRDLPRGDHLVEMIRWGRTVLTTPIHKLQIKSTASR